MIPTAHTDQLGTDHRFDRAPQRIVSLVPSITEWLFDLGLEAEVVGITKFCVRPAHWHRSKPRVGGTKTVRIETVRALQPDLVIANKEENSADDVNALRQMCPVWVSDVRDWDSARDMMERLAVLLHRPVQQQELWKSMVAPVPLHPRKRAVYAVWNDPFMVAGTDTFIHDTMDRLGFQNCTTQRRYPEVSDDALIALAPAVILLPSEPFPFAHKHLPALQDRFPRQQLVLVDGEIFSWYGTRMLRASNYLEQLRKDHFSGES